MAKSAVPCTLTEAQLHAELEKGYADVLAGRTRDAHAFFDEFRRDIDAQLEKTPFP